MVVRTVEEQSKMCEERSTKDLPFVGLLCTRTENWTWYIAAAFANESDAAEWFDRQKNNARVFLGAKLAYAKGMSRPNS